MHNEKKSTELKRDIIKRKKKRKRAKRYAFLPNVKKKAKTLNLLAIQYCAIYLQYE